jgi:hypothetical protein
LKHDIADLSDPMLNDRISELKATRDPAHLAAERGSGRDSTHRTDRRIGIAAATAAITPTRSPSGSKSIRKNCASWNPHGSPSRVFRTRAA